MKNYIYILLVILLTISCNKNETKKNESAKPAPIPKITIKQPKKNKVPIPLPNTINVQLANELFTLEIAISEEEQNQGMMYRESIPIGGGMLFLFPDEQQHFFWMKNTQIDLDIIFLNAQGIITALYNMPREEPQKKDESEEEYCNRLTNYNSKQNVKYAIEIRYTKIQALNLKEGDKIILPTKKINKLLQKNNASF